jgi:hypothetical protein
MPEKRPRVRTRPPESRKAFRMTTPSTRKTSQRALKRARRVRVLRIRPSSKEPFPQIDLRSVYSSYTSSPHSLKFVQAENKEERGKAEQAKKE